MGQKLSLTDFVTGGWGYFQKNWVVCAARFMKPLPYFRPKSVIFPYPISDLTLKSIRVTSCYCAFTVGVNIKREMVLPPHDKEVASKKHTQFKTRVRKPYPIPDQNGQNLYPILDPNG